MSQTNRDLWLQNPDFAKAYQGPRKPTEKKPAKGRKVEALPLPRREGDVLIITLPLPDVALSPNGRASWQRKAEATKEARHSTGLLAKIVAPKQQWQAARIDVTIWRANRGDDDSVFASVKPHRDGIADALGIDDKHFTCGTVQQITGKASCGRREMEIVITKGEA